VTEKKEYVKLWLSYDAYFQPLSTTEVGRLALAMIEYKSHGTEPVLSGNERFIWPAIRRDIDQQSEAQKKQADINRANGSNGGRPPKAGSVAEKPNGLLEAGPVLENPAESHGQGQEQGQGQGQGQDQGQTKKDISSEISKKSAPIQKGFIPPTVEEVAEYCKERRNRIDAAHFVDYYTSNGWKVGRQSMKDWRAAVRGWEKNGFNKLQKGPAKDYSFDLEAFEASHRWHVPEIPGESGG